MEGAGLFPVYTNPSFRPKAHSLDVHQDALVSFSGYHDQAQKLCILRNAQRVVEGEGYGEWEIRKLPVVARAAHVSLIKEDWLYVHGGYGSSKETVNQFTAYSTMERINLVNFKCEKIHYQQVVANVERRWHTSFIYNNKFYIHGGWNDGGPVSDLTALDLDTLSWEVVPTTNAPSERRWHSLTPLSGSSPLYLLFGGYDGDFQKTHSDAHVLNLETMNWTSPSFRGDLPGAHINHTMVRISEKMLLLLGGRDVHKNNYKVNHVLTTDNLTWREVKNSGDLHPINRSGHTAVRLGEHGLVVLGGNNPKYIEPFYYMDTRMLLF